MNKKRRVSIQVLKRIEDAGYAAYLVGGCVRDQFLDIESKDYDICTNADPQTIQQLFKKTIPTGLKHGTVTVIEQGIPFEVTTFRKEAGYIGYRRPSQVTFVSSLETDLSRRDFTINAMAQDRHGRIYDPFGGQEDLQRKRIRCVGNPFDRFSEDALRIIRAARFAAQFHFSLDVEVGRAIEARKDLVSYLSIERVVAELEKIWTASSPSTGLKIFWNFDLWSHLPVFRHWPWKRVCEQEIHAFDLLQDRIVCWAYLLHLGQVERKLLETECRNLRLSKEDIGKVVDCSRLVDQWEQMMTEDRLKLYLLQFGLETTKRAHQLVRLQQLQHPSSDLETTLQHLWNKMPVKSLAELAVNGNDLLKCIQVKAGPWVRETLQHLLVCVALGELPNEKQVLLREGCQFAKDYLSANS